MEGIAFEHGLQPQLLPLFTTKTHFSPLMVKIRLFLGNCQEKKVRRKVSQFRVLTLITEVRRGAPGGSELGGKPESQVI
jgi:hypothetical protein